MASYNMDVLGICYSGTNERIEDSGLTGSPGLSTLIKESATWFHSKGKGTYAGMI